MHEQGSGADARKATGNSGGARRAAGDQIPGGRSAGRGEGLEIRGLAVTLGGEDILVGLDLSVRRGEILALLGPSGCGKTTLLRAVAGLLAPDAGHISWAGEDLRAIATHRRPQCCQGLNEVLAAWEAEAGPLDEDEVESVRRRYFDQ